MDDSPEKCYLNPAHSVLHPHPYNGPDMEHSHHDVELKPGNALWKYLLDLAKIPLEDTHSFIQRKPYISPMSKIHT